MTTPTVSDPDCILCRTVSRIPSRSTPPSIRLIDSANPIIQAPNLLLIPDIQPIVPGHCLIVTRQHITSFSRATPEIWDELSAIKVAVIANRGADVGGYFFFEHGSSTSAPAAGGCISHAHIHFIPAHVDMVRYLAPASAVPIAMKEIGMRDTLPPPDVDYLYYEDMTGRSCTVPTPINPLPRQFVRQAVAAELSLTDWDWTNAIARVWE